MHWVMKYFVCIKMSAKSHMLLVFVEVVMMMWVSLSLSLSLFHSKIGVRNCVSLLHMDPLLYCLISFGGTSFLFFFFLLFICFIFFCWSPPCCLGLIWSWFGWLPCLIFFSWSLWGERNLHLLQASFSTFNRFMDIVLSTSFSWCKTEYPFTHYSLSFLVRNWPPLCNLPLLFGTPHISFITGCFFYQKNILFGPYL